MRHRHRIQKLSRAFSHAVKCCTCFSLFLDHEEIICKAAHPKSTMANRVSRKFLLDFNNLYFWNYKYMLVPDTNHNIIS